MTSSPVSTQRVGPIAQITLNSADGRNHMRPELLTAFEAEIRRLQTDTQLRCLILAGNGSSFCAGADFNAFLPAAAGDPAPLPNETFMALYRPFLTLRELEVPVIAAMNGHAVGGGFGLALLCDLRVAARQAKYGANFARLGIHSGLAVSYLLPRLIGLPRAAELLFTGRLIDGEGMAAMGLANDVADAAGVLPRAWELAQEIAAGAPLAVRMMKRSLWRGCDRDLQAAVEFEAHCQSRTFETRDAREGIRALLEKRDPRFEGC